MQREPYYKRRLDKKYESFFNQFDICSKTGGAYNRKS
jgi:hypothetical protein